jgi:large subunit ribosomal protein L21
MDFPNSLTEADNPPIAKMHSTVAGLVPDFEWSTLASVWPFVRAEEYRRAMYAIIEDGSHQFRVSEGDRIQVDYREGASGDPLVFTKVLLIAGGDGSATIGSPTVAGAQVVAKITNQFRTKKIIIQKFRRRKNVRRRNGHRQPYTIVQITGVTLP